MAREPRHDFQPSSETAGSRVHWFVCHKQLRLLDIPANTLKRLHILGFTLVQADLGCTCNACRRQSTAAGSKNEK